MKKQTKMNIKKFKFCGQRKYNISNTFNEYEEYLFITSEKG